MFTGSEILSLIGRYGFTKKSFANLIGVSNMTIMRWGDNPEKPIPQKYISIIEEIIAKIDSKKEANKTLSYRKIVKDLLDETSNKAIRESVLIGYDGLVQNLLKRNPSIFDPKLKIITDYENIEQKNCDLIGQIDNTLVVFEVKAGVVADNGTLVKLLSTLEIMKKKTSGSVKVQGVLISFGFSSHFIEFAKIFDDVKLKTLDFVLKDVG